MGGLHHEYVEGVQAMTDVKYSVMGRADDRLDDLHCSQAFMDGACGLMCVLQAALVLTGMPRTRIAKLPAVRAGPLLRLWTVAREVYFEGTVEADIVEMVEAFGPVLQAEPLVSTSVRRIGAAVTKAIRAGHVPMVRFESRVWCHWATVIGIETLAGETTPRALLTLDPSASPPWGAFYNARLELKAKATGLRSDRVFSRPYRFITGEAWAVRLLGMVVIKRAQPP